MRHLSMCRKAGDGCPIVNYMIRSATVICFVTGTAGLSDVFLAAGEAPRTATSRPTTGPVEIRGTPVGGLVLSAYAPNAEVPSGEAIRVICVLRNTTERPVRIHDAGSRYDYRVFVEDAEGRQMPLTRLGEQLRDRIGGSRTPIDLAPGESLTRVVIANRHRDMTALGNYRVLVTRSVPDPENPDRLLPIKTGIAEIRVVEPADRPVKGDR